MVDKYYTVPEVAEILQIHIDTVRRFIREKKIRAAKVGRAYRVNEEDLKDYIEKNTEEIEQ